MRKLIISCGTALLIATATTGTAQAHLVTKPKNDTLRAIATSQEHNLKHAQYVCNNGRRATKVWHCKATFWLRREWKETLFKLAPVIKYRSSWLCIYSHEKGADGWQTNTGNGYYGGLQMDWDFMSTYGSELLKRKGTANNWTPDEQMMVAERAHKKRGFHPWPNTARFCGLL